MIPKIFRGQKLGGLMVYLLGAGEHNEHKDRHVIAGSPTLMQAEWLRSFDGPEDNRLSRDAALAIAAEIEVPRKLYGTQAKMRAKPVAASVGARGSEHHRGEDVIEPAAKGEPGQMRNAPNWHCVLAANPGEFLSDEKWAEFATEFMDKMGFGGSADGKQAPARWVAVRHGRSGKEGKGQDHIHIAASLIREDGSKVSTFDYGPGRTKGDKLRSQEVVNELEHKYGLKVLRSRETGGGHSGNSRAEIERAARLGAPETERERLRRVVRAAATATDTEAEFVAALRDAEVSVRPRYGKGGTSEVTGYSVRWRRDGEEVGPWLGGRKLDHDLALTALREQQWTDSDQSREEALAAWRGRADRPGRARRGGPDVENPQIWIAAAQEIGEWQRTLDAIPAGDRAQWAWAAGQASGVFAAFSEALEGNQPGVFAAASKELARSAQVQYAGQRYNPHAAGRAGVGGSTRTGLGAAAAALFDEATRPGGARLRGAKGGDAVSELATLILGALLGLLLVAIAIALRIANAHRARHQILRGVDIGISIRAIDPVRRAWEADLQSRRDQWDRGAAAVITDIAARRAAKTLGEDTTETTGAKAPAEKVATTDRVREITAAAEALVPGVSSAPAWAALLYRLVELEDGGRDAIEDLTTVVHARELGTADDMAAVLSWRIENLLDTSTPTPTAAPTPAAAERIQQRPDTSDAQDPGTPRDVQPLPRRLSRPFFTELPESERAMQRVAVSAASTSAAADIAPRTWDDDTLVGELLHRRAEVQALREELEERRAGGPQVAQVREDNAALTKQAAAIKAAKQDIEEAETLEKDQAAREKEKTRLERELANTSKWSPRVRGRLETDIGDVAEQIDQHAAGVAEARDKADESTDATGVPEDDWASVLRSATEAQCQRRVREAVKADAAALTADSGMLAKLERDLAKVDTEHERAGRMTSAQRAESVREAKAQQRSRPQRSPGAAARFMTGLERDDKDKRWAPDPKAVPWEHQRPQQDDRGPDHGSGRGI